VYRDGTPFCILGEIPDSRIHQFTNLKTQVAVQSNKKVSPRKPFFVLLAELCSMGLMAVARFNHSVYGKQLAQHKGINHPYVVSPTSEIACNLLV
jgi:hypothetical protein